MNPSTIFEGLDAVSIGEMSIEQLEDLKHCAEEKYADIQMQLECIQQSGGVSRSHAAAVVEYLPAEMILESFTAQVTHTNYEITCEALSTAAKVAIGVAVMAGLGAILFFANRIANRDRPEVDKQRVSKVEEIIEVNSSIQQLRNKLHEQLVKDLQLDRPSLEETRAATVKRLKESVPPNAVMRFLIAASKTGTMELGAELQEVVGRFQFGLGMSYKEVLLPAIDAAERYSKTGKADSLYAFEKAKGLMVNETTSTKHEYLAPFIEALTKRGSSFDSSEIKIEKDTPPEEAVKKYLEWGARTDLLKPNEEDAFFDKISKFEVRFKIASFDVIMKELSEVAVLARDLPKQEKRLEALTNVPKEVTDVINAYVAETKRRLRFLEAVQTATIFDIQSFNRAVNYLGKNLMSEFSAQGDALEEILSDDDCSVQVKAIASKLLKEMREASRK